MGRIWLYSISSVHVKSSAWWFFSLNFGWKHLVLHTLQPSSIKTPLNVWRKWKQDFSQAFHIRTSSNANHLLLYGPCRLPGTYLLLYKVILYNLPKTVIAGTSLRALGSDGGAMLSSRVEYLVSTVVKRLEKTAPGSRRKVVCSIFIAFISTIVIKMKTNNSEFRFSKSRK